MRSRVLLGLVLVATLFLSSSSQGNASAANCQFVLGFKALHDMIPDKVGDCLVDEHHNAVNGDGLQETVAWHGKGGLLVWRKADNWTAFTDGNWTWINGPQGLQQRQNSDRFSWEADHLLPALMNAEYRLPLSRGKDTAFRLSGGNFEIRDEHIRASLVEKMTVFGNLNDDGVPDAVVLVAVNTGGSGIFEYAVAFVDRNGVPAQVGQEFLGDRVKVNSLAIANRQITVDMVTQGPNEPFCCPTLRVVKTLGIQVPAN